MRRVTRVVTPKPNTPWVCESLVPTVMAATVSRCSSTISVGRTGPKGVPQVVAAVLPSDNADKP
jgi:hypothetical protein